jgi:hypothetical protein
VAEGSLRENVPWEELRKPSPKGIEFRVTLGKRNLSPPKKVFVPSPKGIGFRESLPKRTLSVGIRNGPSVFMCTSKNRPRTSAMAVSGRVWGWGFFKV